MKVSKLYTKKTKNKIIKKITHISHLDNVACPQIDNVTVGSTIDTALIERHNVLCKRTGFVWEHILDLS